MLGRVLGVEGRVTGEDGLVEGVEGRVLGRLREEPVVGLREPLLKLERLPLLKLLPRDMLLLPRDMLPPPRDMLPPRLPPPPPRPPPRAKASGAAKTTPSRMVIHNFQCFIVVEV